MRIKQYVVESSNIKVDKHRNSLQHSNDKITVSSSRAVGCRNERFGNSENEKLVQEIKKTFRNGGLFLENTKKMFLNVRHTYLFRPERKYLLAERYWQSCGK